MSALASTVLSGLNLLNINPLQPTAQYSIVDASSSSVLVTADTWKRVEYLKEQHVADYPIEQGGFESYNKVAVPFDLRLVLCCGGPDFLQQLASGALASVDGYLNSILGTNFTQPMTRLQFILACESLADSLQLVDVITPDRTYQNLNCIHFSYTKTKEQGANMVVGELWFREIRQATTSSYSTNGNPSVNSNSVDAADSTSVGSVTTQTPNASQQAQINAASFV